MNSKTIIGVRAHDYGKQPIDRLLCAIAADRWQTVQLAFPKAVSDVASFDDVTPALLEETKRSLDETALSIAVLGVYVEPSLADETARAEQSRILHSALSQVKTLRAACIGTETTAMKKQPGISREQALRQLYRTLEEVIPQAEKLGVDLALEPVWYHTLNTPELTRTLLTDMRSARLKVIFDPVNLLQPGSLDSQQELWERCIDCFGEYIAALHIKGEPDKNGTPLPLQTSKLDYRSLFALMRKLDVPVLRELAVPSGAENDITFIKSLF